MRLQAHLYSKDLLENSNDNFLNKDMHKMEECDLFLNNKLSRKVETKIENKIVNNKKAEAESYPYKISVIIPVYNTEKYIQETLDSIYSQTMSLEDIQIILLNDGSTDGTHEILKYNAALYPDSIVYINKENEGVSETRNKGLLLAQGKYINFIDSDDKWGAKTFEKAYEFLEEHPEIDIVSSRLTFFDNLIGEHPLNYKFNKSENIVVDLLQDYNNIQMHASSSFFRNTAIKNIRFDSELKYAEDAKFVYDVLKKTYKLGMLSYLNGCYFYRKRADESSAIDTALYKETYYLSTLKKYHTYLINDSVKQLGYLPKYVQNVILYDLQYRLRFSDATIYTLDSETLKEYKNEIMKIIARIDDDVLMNPKLRQINAVIQAAILEKKYPDKSIYIKKENGLHDIYFGNIYLKSIENMYLKTESVYLKNGVLKLAFSLPQINKDLKVEPVLDLGNKKIVKADAESVLNEQNLLGEKISESLFFRFDIPIEKFNNNFTIRYLINGRYYTDIKNVGKTLKTNFSNTKKPFKNYNDKTIRMIDNKVFKFTRKKRWLTLKNLIGLLSKRKTFKSGVYKTSGILLKKYNQKNIWLFTDRLGQGGDNAEALFDYVLNNHQEITPYFLIEKGNSDFKRLKKKYGNRIVVFNSKKHHFLMFFAQKICTSHTEGYLFNPFGIVNGQFIRELLDYDFIFLQHGVTQNNVSKLFHKFNKPVDYFVTSSKSEQKDIINNYGYLDNEVILTGLARFDLLEKEIPNKRYIVFMPTWRPQLLKGTDDEFLESVFYKKTFEFLNDSEIKEMSKKIDIQFHLHPRMKERFEKFYKKLTHIKFMNHTDYHEIISNSSVLITDVSSVAFDMAYLNKPVLYYQFDLEDIYHYAIYSPGYFKYDKNGFGPVLKKEKELVEALKQLQKNEFKLDEIYQKRIEVFFEYQDKENRKRLFNKIKY